MSVPDYPLEETIDFKFTTRQFSDGVPTTLAGTPVVEIYEDNSLTQITAAETLTVDFDGVTGLNNLRVVATAANGFESGKSYAAVLSAGTVGGTSVVGEVVAQWSMERSPVNWDHVTAPTTAVDLAGTDIQLVDTATSNTDMRGTDSAALASVCTEARLAELDAANLPADVDTLLTRITATIFSGITSLAEWLGLMAGKQAADATALTEIKATGAGSGTYSETTDSLEAVRDTAPLGTAMRGTDSAALASVCTEARLAELDAANLPTDVDAILADTADMQPKLGTPAGADMSADIATVDSNVDAILVDTNELQTDWANGGRLDLLLDGCATDTSIKAITIDGAKDLENVLKEVYAVIVNKVTPSSAAGTLTLAWRNNADDADVLTHSITEATGARTKS